MWSRANLFGALAFIAVAVVAPALPAWLVSLATIAFANALVVLGLVDPVAGRPRPFGQAAVLRNRRLCGGVAQPLRGWRDVFLLIAASVRLRPALSHSWSDSCWRAIATSSSRCSASRCR